MKRILALLLFILLPYLIGNVLNFGNTVSGNWLYGSLVIFAFIGIVVTIIFGIYFSLFGFK
jgi:hypothetical protein